MHTPRPGRHTARFIAAIAVTTSLCNCIGVPSKRYRRGSSCKRDRKSLNPGSRRFDRFARIPPPTPLLSSPLCQFFANFGFFFFVFFYFLFLFLLDLDQGGISGRDRNVVRSFIIYHLRREIFKREPVLAKFSFFSVKILFFILDYMYALYMYAFL